MLTAKLPNEITANLAPLIYQVRLLWALYFLKFCSTESMNAYICGCFEKSSNMRLKGPLFYSRDALCTLVPVSIILLSIIVATCTTNKNLR